MSGEIVLGEDLFRRRADGDWEMLTRAPDVTITFGSTEATERRWRQLAQALDEIAAERAEVARLRAELAAERVGAASSAVVDNTVMNLVDGDRLCDRLLAEGWQLVGERKGCYVRLHASGADVRGSLLIPTDPQASDYAELISEAVATLRASRQETAASRDMERCPACLGRAEMEAIKSYILAHLGKPQSWMSPALWEGLVTERLIREGLPESVIDWVLEDESIADWVLEDPT